jgi:catechol 2,3-dioxygenase-like lactoylglutathione lyase family enzyme
MAYASELDMDVRLLLLHAFVLWLEHEPVLDKGAKSRFGPRSSASRSPRAARRSSRKDVALAFPRRRGATPTARRLRGRGRWPRYRVERTQPLGGIVPAMPIHHVDLAVADVERSLAFYRALLGPLGWTKELRYPTYRGTEEVVYLHEPTTRTGLGLRPADEGEYHYYSVGIEHLAFEVDERDEVDAAYSRCLAQEANIHFPPEEDRDIEGYYAFFVFDPDGIRVEVLWWPRDETAG